ncbi:MAG TPA: FAD:protein FMN transferase [Actinomycetes bacterium]|nr:FAD:protein FMN transferase [Actinomycetes bacterium]
MTDRLPATEWDVWGTTARVVVSDPAALGPARTLVEELLGQVDLAASRFRADSEVTRLAGSQGRPTEVSPLLAELLEVALDAARRTDGDVDPTVGAALRDLGYDRDFAALPLVAKVRVVARPAPGWQRVRLDGTTVTVPVGTLIDLGATAKAWTADRAAQLVRAELGCGVLVSLGGDIATSGPAPEGGWRVRVQDRLVDPGATITLPAGAAVATSSTVRRTWVQADRSRHHVLDPRTGSPAPAVWRSATVAAWTCVEANTLTTAALVRGGRAEALLRAAGVPARLVTSGGHVVTLGGWPAEAEVEAAS